VLQKMLTPIEDDTGQGIEPDGFVFYLYPVEGDVLRREVQGKRD
jgi:hypothetical protein